MQETPQRSEPEIPQSDWARPVDEYLVRRKVIFVTHWFLGHNNPGERLLYDGAQAMFRQLGCRVLGEVTGSDAEDSCDGMDPEAVLVVSGGGNLGGALYPDDGLLGLRLADRHPQREVVFLPQTYLTPWKPEDFAFLGRIAARPNVTFFLREAASWHYFRHDYGTGWCQPDVVDMFLKPSPASGRQGFLSVRRRDAESHLMFPGDDWTGWPMERLVETMRPYAAVLSDRLHVAVLARSLGLRVWLVANSYYKNASYYATWWAQDPAVTFLPDQAAVDACLADLPWLRPAGAAPG